MNSYYPWSKLKQLQEWKGKWNMITIERIKEIIKEEFRVNLYETDSGVYMSKADLVYVNLNYSAIYVSLECKKKGYSLEMNAHFANENGLLNLIKKFKKVRKMI